jgi:hypothetical protein
VIRLITTKGQAWCYEDCEKLTSRWSNLEPPKTRQANEIQAEMYFCDASNDPADKPKWRKVLQVQKMSVPNGEATQ